MQQISDIFSARGGSASGGKNKPKAPAYQWQDMALNIIKELAIPQSKRNSVFKVCKDYDKNFVEKCVDDTKELAQGSGRWRYFFKLIAEYKKDKVNGEARQDESRSERGSSGGEGGLGHTKKEKSSK